MAGLVCRNVLKQPAQVVESVAAAAGVPGRAPSVAVRYWREPTDFGLLESAMVQVEGQVNLEAPSRLEKLPVREGAVVKSAPP
jgi:hypothetical protein